VGDLALLPLGGSCHFVAVSEILYIKATGHYSHVVLSNGRRHWVRQPFRTWRVPVWAWEVTISST